MTSIALTPDRARWDAEITSKFNRFERRLRGGVGSRATQLRRQVVPVVERRRARPADRTKTRTPLAAAIEQSIRSTTGEIGIIVGDRTVLDGLTPYWRAIELGSSHIVGMAFYGYSGPAGVSHPSSRRFRRDSRRATASEMRAGGLNPTAKVAVKRPIKPHRYLSVLSVEATRAVREETHMRMREAFGGIPYKRQGV